MLLDTPLVVDKLIIATKFICSIKIQVIEIVRAIIFCRPDKRIDLIPIDVNVKMNADNIKIYNKVKITRMMPGKFSTSSLG